MKAMRLFYSVKNRKCVNDSCLTRIYVTKICKNKCNMVKKFRSKISEEQNTENGLPHTL